MPLSIRSYKFVGLKESDKPDKKYMVIFINKKSKREKIIHFGAKTFNDFTTFYKNAKKTMLAEDALEVAEKRRQAYIKRHNKEDWSKNNILSSAYFAGNLLWGSRDDNLAVPNVRKMLKIIRYRDDW
jgi:hypothetical protein